MCVHECEWPPLNALAEYCLHFVFVVSNSLVNLQQDYLQNDVIKYLNIITAEQKEGKKFPKLCTLASCIA